MHLIGSWSDEVVLEKAIQLYSDLEINSDPMAMVAS